MRVVVITDCEVFRAEIEDVFDRRIKRHRQEDARFAREVFPRLEFAPRRCVHQR